MLTSKDKILFFSPYGVFSTHLNREMILIQRLLLRGYDITYVSCDQAFQICDYKNECSRCFSISETTLKKHNFPLHWLSQYFRPQDTSDALEWVNSIAPEDFPIAIFNDLKIGDWVRSSVHFMLRVSKLDFTDPLTYKTYRDFLISGAAFSLAATRILNEVAYDRIIITNGRFFSHRIFLEMAKKRKIPIVTHEVGHYFQTIQVQFDCISNSYNNLSDKWLKDIQTPLSLQALTHVHQIILDKRYRRRGSFVFFSPLPEKITPNKKIAVEKKKTVLCLLSSEYEFIASPDFPYVIGTQTDWLELLAVEMEKYPNHHFVIKLHPNSEDSIIVDVKRIFASAERLNCSYEVLWPNTPRSTYNLMDEAEFVLVYWSTAGIEAACCSKKVFCVTQCVYYNYPFLTSLRSKESHAEELELFLLDPNPSLNIQKDAYRFSYRYFIEQSIPFTSISNPKDGVSSFNQPVEYYTKNTTLPSDPYLDYYVDCMMSGIFPEVQKVNGVSVDETEIQEKFFFRCLSILHNFGDISFYKKRILLLLPKISVENEKHCFENANRLAVFDQSTAFDWLAFFLRLDGHQVYTINPDDKSQLTQWAHEYGIFSGVYTIRKLIDSPALLKFLSELLLRSSFLTHFGRKLLFHLGKSLKKAPLGELVEQFSLWLKPEHTFIHSELWNRKNIQNLSSLGNVSIFSENQSICQLADRDESKVASFSKTNFKSFSFSNENLENLMNNDRFENDLKNIFASIKSAMI